MNGSIIGGVQDLQLGTVPLICALISASIAFSGCNSNTSSGTTGGNGTIVVPLTGFWNGSWSRNTTLADLINDTDTKVGEDITQLDPEDGIARLQITSASGPSQTISGELLMSGFSCFDTAHVSGSWSGSNIGLTATNADTEIRLSLSGHQTASGQIKLAYSVASGDTCDAKRGSIALIKSG